MQEKHSKFIIFFEKFYWNRIRELWPEMHLPEYCTETHLNPKEELVEHFQKHPSTEAIAREHLDKLGEIIKGHGIENSLSPLYEETIKKQHPKPFTRDQIEDFEHFVTSLWEPMRNVAYNLYDSGGMFIKEDIISRYYTLTHWQKDDDDYPYNLAKTSALGYAIRIEALNAFWGQETLELHVLGYADVSNSIAKRMKQPCDVFIEVREVERR